MPEEWVGSMVEAQPGMNPLHTKDLAVVETADGPRFLRDIIDDDRSFTWRWRRRRGGGWRLSFLLKTSGFSHAASCQAPPFPPGLPMK